MAACAGVVACSWGALVVVEHRLLGVAVALWGAAIAVTGTRSRVVGVAVDQDGLDVRYAVRPPFALPWPDCRALRPPRWPLAGWVVEGEAAHRTLMPSDVLGQERSLESIVGFAGLRFDGRSWVRAP